ncbi:hypothetical protein Zmor_026797 [Zophobas morio]|uniref:Ubiquitin-like protease family profile domain-containing protein n=1 Tax=Zophobas morio TaxID=2755281 RepID=A0AA38M5U2_9CUCU|nr:hypothetical protein Zmor_026797 [Zophobas morio]
MESLYPEMEIFLNQLFPHKPQHKFHKVRQQPNNTDCAVYAIAFATSLLHNRDPSKENYDHPKMRSHLLDIYSTTELLPFPIEPSADALRKRKVNKVTFQHKEHSAAALHMRKVRAQKKLEAHQLVQNIRQIELLIQEDSEAFSCEPLSLENALFLRIVAF